MSEQPFGASTWSVRGLVSNLQLNGVYSGIVGAPVSGCYDPVSGVMQAFGQQAHHFTGFTNMVAASLDHGSNWVVTFNEAHDPGFNVAVLGGWTLPHPSLEGKRLHYQVRQFWQHAFLVFDGTIPPGSITLYASENGTTWVPLQDLHTWPALNQIGGNGGAATFNNFPSFTKPILLEGTGPDGEDAYWMATSFSFNAGGAGNRTTIKASTLWRSVDGGLTWENVRDLEPVLGIQGFFEWHKSTTGRIVLVSGGAGSINFTDDGDDLINASWSQANFTGAPGIRGELVPMYGGAWLTYSQGTLTGPGSSWISCDDCANFSSGGVEVIPQNRGGYLAKLGLSEALIITSGFSDPLTQTVAEYSDDGGETWRFSEPWIVSVTGEIPSMLALRTGARPIVMTRGGRIFVSSDNARGVAQTRTICPLANAGLVAARPLNLCGHSITVNPC